MVNKILRAIPKLYLHNQPYHLTFGFNLSVQTDSGIQKLCDCSSFGSVFGFMCIYLYEEIQCKCYCYCIIFV